MNKIQNELTKVCIYTTKNKIINPKLGLLPSICITFIFQLLPFIPKQFLSAISYTFCVYTLIIHFVQYLVPREGVIVSMHI